MIVWFSVGQGRNEYSQREAVLPGREDPDSDHLAHPPGEWLPGVSVRALPEGDDGASAPGCGKDKIKVMFAAPSAECMGTG